jgi:hypothetical protein
MKFNERREHHYDAAVFKRYDTQTALKIHAEYVQKGSAIPAPEFREVDRSEAQMDPLYHCPVEDRTQFIRAFRMPCLFYQDKPLWVPGKNGYIRVAQPSKFWCANLILQGHDYFPMRGDIVYHAGSRWFIEKVEIDPSAIWQQTNVWLGLVCYANILIEGDARPTDPANVHHLERSPTAEIE